MGIARPSFADMNGIAARALVSVLLPSQSRGSYRGGGHAPSPNRGGAGAGSAAGPVGSPELQLPALRRTGGTAGRGVGSEGTAAGSEVAGPRFSSASAASCSPPNTSPLADLVSHLCCHPAYRMLTLRAIPQMPPSSIDFTTFTWPAILKRLRQMFVTGSVLEEGMDWSVMPHSPASGSAALGAGPRANRAVANWLVLRGQGAGEVDVADFADPALTAAWAVDPLSVSYNSSKFGRCLMSASLLSNDRRCVGPIQRMLEHAYGMLESRAFVHQYETYGMGVSDFQACFARVEDIAQRYIQL
ncbi:hypothetical protein Vretimale_2529 [Volvox reticuliferus]|nr:hypothetical protein Vretimale_2529 [Volvox reticuliferus]